MPQNFSSILTGPLSFSFGSKPEVEVSTQRDVIREVKVGCKTYLIRSAEGFIEIKPPGKKSQWSRISIESALEIGGVLYDVAHRAEERKSKLMPGNADAANLATGSPE